MPRKGPRDCKGCGPALIDDDTPAPAHTRFSRNQLAKVLAVGLGLWALVLAVLVALQGLQGTLTQSGRSSPRPRG